MSCSDSEIIVKGVETLPSHSEQDPRIQAITLKLNKPQEKKKRKTEVLFLEFGVFKLVRLRIFTVFAILNA